MMFEVVKFKREHLLQLNEPEGSAVKKRLSDDDYNRLENTQYSFSFLADGRAVACAGVGEYWKGRGEAWFIFDKDSKKHFIRIFKAAKKLLNSCSIPRIEAVVNCDFDPGHRWVKLFGFSVDAPRMKKYGVRGQDCTLYSLVRGEPWAQQP